MADKYFKTLVKMPGDVNLSKAFRHIRQYLRQAGLPIPSYRWKRSEDSTYIVISAKTDIILRVSIWKLQERGGEVMSTLTPEIEQLMKAITPVVMPGKLSESYSRGS